MKKKPNTKNLTKRFNSIYLLWIAVALLVISQIVSFIYINNLRRDISGLAKESFRLLLSSDEEGRYKSPVINVSEGKVYIPEARVYFPLNNTSRNLRYEYRSGSGSTQLYISVNDAVGRQFSQDDPTCDKMVMISPIKKPYSNMTLLGEIPSTKDGLRYLYVHSADKCGIYHGNMLNDVANVVKALQGY